MVDIDKTIIWYDKREETKNILIQDNIREGEKGK